MLKKLGILLVILVAAGAALAYAFADKNTKNMETSGPAKAKNTNPNKTVYDFNATSIDGTDVSLKKYKKKIVMVVNTASECGYTPQYKGLQAIYDKYRDKGFVILGFPANNFGGQEPGSNEEIKEFCTLKYKVTFPMFAKISVKGEDQHPLYKFLTDKELHPETGGEVTWNFNKFLVNEKGAVIARFTSKNEPESVEVTSEIEKALNNLNKSGK